jgi:hypothetical protein
MVDYLGGKTLKSLPFWFPKKENAFWYFLFIIIFIFSNDLWGWNHANPMLFGLPVWVIYLLILTILTSIAFYIFSKVFWRTSE